MNNDSINKLPISTEVITTGDGSVSLYRADIDETYHSRHGAVQESLHVFIDAGLKQLGHLGEINVLEVGLGTALNALLTLVFAEENKIPIRYTSLETFPLPQEVWSKVSYAQNELQSAWYKALHEAPWNERVEITPYFSIRKMEAAAESVSLQADEFDLMYYDAFGPRAQAEMWRVELFSHLSNFMKPNSVWVTYCAKGQVRRDLEACGWKMERIPGPPGKREMLRGIKQSTE